jgi:hypothetical protein
MSRKVLIVLAIILHGPAIWLVKRRSFLSGTGVAELRHLNADPGFLRGFLIHAGNQR